MHRFKQAEHDRAFNTAKQSQDMDGVGDKLPNWDLTNSDDELGSIIIGILTKKNWLTQNESVNPTKNAIWSTGSWWLWWIQPSRNLGWHKDWDLGNQKLQMLTSKTCRFNSDNEQKMMIDYVG